MQHWHRLSDSKIGPLETTYQEAETKRRPRQNQKETKKESKETEHEPGIIPWRFFKRFSHDITPGFTLGFCIDSCRNSIKNKFRDSPKISFRCYSQVFFSGIHPGLVSRIFLGISSIFSYRTPLWNRTSNFPKDVYKNNSKLLTFSKSISWRKFWTISLSIAWKIVWRMFVYITGKMDRGITGSFPEAQSQSVNLAEPIWE